MDPKKWYTSKTMWVNALAVIAGIIQGVTGEAWFNAEAQVGVLALANMILRAVTKTGLA
jgi:hypothetical protein